MSIRKKTIGVAFPFNDSDEGDYIRLNKTAKSEVDSNLRHLLLTNKGSRYWLPDFGTNLRQFVFENITEDTKELIRNEITTAVEKYLPNLTIDNIEIRDYRYDGKEEEINKELTLTIKIDYRFTSSTFEFKSLVVLTF